MVTIMSGTEKGTRSARRSGSSCGISGRRPARSARETIGRVAAGAIAAEVAARDVRLRGGVPPRVVDRRRADAAERRAAGGGAERVDARGGRQATAAGRMLRDPAHPKLLTEADEADADGGRRRTSRRRLRRRTPSSPRSTTAASATKKRGVRRVRGLAGARVFATRASRSRRPPTSPLGAPTSSAAPPARTCRRRRGWRPHPPGEARAGLGRRPRACMCAVPAGLGERSSTRLEVRRAARPRTVRRPPRPTAARHRAHAAAALPPVGDDGARDALAAGDEGLRDRLGLRRRARCEARCTTTRSLRGRRRRATAPTRRRS